MKGAIPVLPICLAWFCLVCNVIAPGTGENRIPVECDLRKSLNY